MSQNNQLKVVIAGSFLFPYGSATAARMRNLAMGLVENGASVHLMAMAPMRLENGQQFGLAFAPGVTYDIIAPWSPPNGKMPLRNELQHKPVWFMKNYSAIFRAYRIFRHLVSQRQCNLFIGYGRSAAQLIPMAWFSRKHGITSILDVVEIHNQFYGFGGKLNPIYWDWKVGEQYMPSMFDGISVIARALIPNYVKDGRNNYILMPSLENWDKPSTSMESESSPIRRIMYLGAMLERDAPEMLFATIKQLAQQRIPIRFDLVGKYRETVRGRALVDKWQKDQDIASVVNWVGRVDDLALKRHFAAADAFILPRRDALTERASFPTRLVEYLKHGKPVFAVT